MEGSVKRGMKRSSSPGEESPRKRTRMCFSEPPGEVETHIQGEERPLNKRTSRLLDLNQVKDESTHSSLGFGPDEFEDKYEEGLLLGEGSYGSVFAGFRTADHLPVAIKHIQKDMVRIKHVDESGQTLPSEIAVMHKLSQAGSLGNSVAVSLLDWYDLDQEIILVIERPVPCVDLYEYRTIKGGVLQEDEAKVIFKQLLAGVKELYDNNIFHRDIKLENILIDTSSDVPRVRIIDFGLSCFFKEGSSFDHFYGTPIHAPPEWRKDWSYQPGPASVWQMGVVLYEMLHPFASFETEVFCMGEQRVSSELSKDCQSFFRRFLTMSPHRRPTMEELQLHKWLN